MNQREAMLCYCYVRCGHIRGCSVFFVFKAVGAGQGVMYGLKSIIVMGC